MTQRGVAARPLHVRVQAGAGCDVALGHEHRPQWRGRVHLLALTAAVPALAILLLAASRGDARFRVALAVYAVGLCSMLGASTTYHRWVHALRARCTWRRIDHAAVLAAIAGSSTPIVAVALPGTTGWVLIAALWSAAVIGACCKLSRRRGGDGAGTAMYVVAIVLGAVAVPWLYVREGVVPAALVVAGGVVYIVGAVCFATQRPVLRPKVFSYHEVWHVFTVVAAVSHFVAIWILATGRGPSP